MAKKPSKTDLKIQEAVQEAKELLILRTVGTLAILLIIYASFSSIKAYNKIKFGDILLNTNVYHEDVGCTYKVWNSPENSKIEVEVLDPRCKKDSVFIYVPEKNVVRIYKK